MEGAGRQIICGYAIAPFSHARAVKDATFGSEGVRGSDSDCSHTAESEMWYESTHTRAETR
jgi:hypothetical protein